MELAPALGLGIAPVPDIVTLLEMEIGVRVYVAGSTATFQVCSPMTRRSAPCMLLNANHPRDRRTQTAGHETGHFVSTRREPEFCTATNGKQSREERYANAFGRAFLTPARGVMQKFQEVTAGSDRLTPPACHCARAFLRRLARGDGAAARRTRAHEARDLGLVPGQRRHHRRTGAAGSGRSVGSGRRSAPRRIAHDVAAESARGGSLPAGASQRRPACPALASRPHRAARDSGRARRWKGARPMGSQTA